MLNAKIVAIAGLLISWIAVPAFADLIPPGMKSVRHELVFVPSDSLQTHRLIAAPTRGFGGVEEITPGERFHFSSKYGTRIYVLPGDAALPDDFDRELFSEWPSSEPPIGEISAVSMTSSVASALTTLRLTDVVDGQPMLEIVLHEEFTASGQPATLARSLVRPFVLVPIACGIMLVVWWCVRRRSARSKIAEV